MNRNRSLFLTVSLLVLFPVATGVLWSAAEGADSDDAGDSLYKQLAIFSEVFGLVRNNYVDPTKNDELLAGALDGVGDALDPFSALVLDGEMDDYERSQQLAVARSGLVLVKDHGVAFALNVEEGSPSAAAGIERGDIVAAVGGEDTRLMPLWKVQRLLAGDPGQTLEIRILRQGEPSEKKVTLAEFTAPAPRLEEDRGVPILHLSRIEHGTADATRTLLAGLTERGAKKLLIDLQGVGGGDAAEAFAVAGQFVQGPLGRLEDRGKSVREFQNDDQPLWSGEIAIAVDGGTYGAAEIVAEALHARAGAKLVGTKTFGWAGERSFIDLSAGARLNLTTAFYVGPNGEEIAGGLSPELPVDDLSRRFGEADRPFEQIIRERGVDLLLGQLQDEQKAA